MSLGTIYLAHIALLLTYFGLALAALPYLSEAIPMHFNLDGRPTRWAPATALSWLSLPLLSAGSAAFMYGLMRLSRRVPQLWNISEKQAFLDLPPGPRAGIQERLEASMGVVAILTTLLLMTMHMGGYEVAVGRSERLPVYAYLSFAAWLVAVIWLSIRASHRAGQEVRVMSEGLRAREARRG